MPTQPDTIDIEQLRAQLDAIYSPEEEIVPETAENSSPSPDTLITSPYAVTQLTQEAKSHSAEKTDLRIKDMLLIGGYINTLRQGRMSK